MAQFPQQTSGEWPLPHPALSYAAPMANARPTSATVIAILGIVYASLSILVFGITIAGTLAMLAFMTGNAIPFWTRGMLIWQIARSIVGLLLAGVLLTGSIALLRTTWWSRRLIIWYAAAEIVIAIVVMLVEMLYLLPEQEKQFVAMGAHAGMMSAQYLASAFKLLFLLAFPIVALVFMMRANIRRACERRG